MAKLQSHKWRENARQFEKRATFYQSGKQERYVWTHKQHPRVAVSVVVHKTDSGSLSKEWRVEVDGRIDVRVGTRAEAFALGVRYASRVTGGTYTLTVDGRTTEPIAHNADAGIIEKAVDKALDKITKQRDHQ